MVSDKTCNFAPAFENKRAFSSVGLEHLPYKQRVGGSNPSTPTKIQALSFVKRAFSSAGSEHLPYKQRVGGSNPSTPTNRFSNQKHGWFPEWPNGADCKSAASSFGGSNPSPPTSTRDCFAAVSFFILFFYSLLFRFAPYILGVLGCPREALFLLFTLQQDYDSRSALLLVVKVVFVVFHTQSSICAT